LDNLLREKSNNQIYFHAEFLKECFKENVIIPTGLAVSIFEKRINEVIKKEKRWVFIYGFPGSMQQLYEFEEKVSIIYTNRVLLTTINIKNKLYTISELLGRGNVPACRRIGTISK
jgi:hypothetical protein